MSKLPHNTTAEASVVGAVLVRPSLLDELTLQGAEFYDPRHRTVYACALGLRGQQKPVDHASVCAELERAGKLAPLGGLAFVGELVDAATPYSTTHLAREIADCHLQRQVIERASEIATKGLAGGLSGEELLAELERLVSGIQVAGPDTTVDVGTAYAQLVPEYLRTVEAAERGELVSLKLRTGIAAVDQLLGGGLPKASSVVVAGRPSMGKSAFVRSLADSINQLGGRVHYFSTEDTLRALVYRQLADHGDLDLGHLWSMKLGRLELQRLIAAANDLGERRGWLVQTTRGIRIADLCRQVRRHRRSNKTDLVVVDYAQIISAPGRTEYEQVSAVSRACAELAANEDVTVVLCSQISRESEKSDNKRPTLGQLKGSGSLEQDAEVVLLMHRPEYYLSQRTEDNTPRHQQLLEQWRGLGQVICAKAKNGPTGDAVLAWDAKSATYRDRGGRRTW